MNTILVTGSNRGLGLEWVRQYADQDWRVYATCRKPEHADALKQLVSRYPNVSLHQLDVTSSQHLGALTAELGDKPLDLLINNAGIYRERWGKDKLGRINYTDWQDTFAVNTLGAMRVSEGLIENVTLSKLRLIVSISSHMGSISETNSPNDYAYRSSKIALNIAMKGLSLEVAERGVGILLLHPGWVRTRMGGNTAPLSPQQSVQRMRERVASFTLQKSGAFYNYDGNPITW